MKGKRPDLKDQVLVPEVLIHAFLRVERGVPRASCLPAEYWGDAVVTLHGSHSRPERTGYNVIRVRMKGWQPDPEVRRFHAEFLVDNVSVWSRSAGVAVTQESALLVKRPRQRHDLSGYAPVTAGGCGRSVGMTYCKGRRT